MKHEANGFSVQIVISNSRIQIVKWMLSALILVITNMFKEHLDDWFKKVNHNKYANDSVLDLFFSIRRTTLSRKYGHVLLYADINVLNKQRLCSSWSLQKVVNYSLLGWQEASEMMKVLAPAAGGLKAGRETARGPCPSLSKQRAALA